MQSMSSRSLRHAALASLAESAFASCSTASRLMAIAAGCRATTFASGAPGEARLLAIDLGLELGEPGADHAFRLLALGDCVD
jgi:hypothetical protein